MLFLFCFSYGKRKVENYEWLRYELKGIACSVMLSFLKAPVVLVFHDSLKGRCRVCVCVSYVEGKANTIHVTEVAG